MSGTPGLRTPKEHGAWDMLYVSFAVGALVAGRASWPVALVLVAATTLFFAREALRRARRARRQGRTEPGLGRILAVELGLLVACAVLLLQRYRMFGLVPLGLLAALLLAVNLDQAGRHEERSVGAEILAVLGFAMAAPTAHYAAHGTWHAAAVWLWGLCVLYFASSVLHVKLLVLGVHPNRRPRHRRMRWMSLLYHLLLLSTLLALVLRSLLPLLTLVAFVPSLTRAAWSLVRRPGKLDLRRVGILEIVYSLHFLVFTWLAFARA
ncbi:MAG: YwiC-like family protein [Candidatus Krumholzibacteriia bacterium]